MGDPNDIWLCTSTGRGQAGPWRFLLRLYSIRKQEVPSARSAKSTEPGVKIEFTYFQMSTPTLPATRNIRTRLGKPSTTTWRRTRNTKKQ